MTSGRDRLVADHLELVQAIAGKLKRTLGKSIDYDDLVGYGHRGLMEAADRFDPAQGVTFTTFAYYRIRGAMLDGMRTMGWYSRGDYARYRAEERAQELLQNASEREGAAREAGAEATSSKGETLEQLAELLSSVATVHITSLEAASNVSDDRVQSAHDSLEMGQLGTRVRQAVGTLPEKERRLMELYYFEDKTLEDAGGALGLSKSWACRLHARAVSLLRDALADQA
ncbi:MAG TPA: sigma-70 family RNA polymerase sigma factor [Polyangia bacterium]